MHTPKSSFAGPRCFLPSRTSSFLLPSPARSSVSLRPSPERSLCRCIPSPAVSSASGCTGPFSTSCWRGPEALREWRRALGRIVGVRESPSPPFGYTLCRTAVTLTVPRDCCLEMSSSTSDVFRLLRDALAESVHYYLRGLYRELTAKNVFLWAQAIAFKVLVTIVPIVILGTGLVGRILQGKDAFTAVERFIRGLLPPSQSNELITFLEQVESASGTIVGLGGIGLFLSAVSLFITLRIAVSNAFEQNWHNERSLFGGYLFDVRMVLQVGGLFILTVGLSVALPTLF